MNRQEREEWEILCRQYNVDSLQEAIQGCREELEFLIHCAERLEPRTEEEETPFNISSPRRFYTPGNAVPGMQETPFLHAETKEQSVFEQNIILLTFTNIKYGKLEIYRRKSRLHGLGSWTGVEF